MADASGSSRSESADRRARARTLAGLLLDIGAVELRPSEPFTWSSGLVAPIYCDNRLTLSHPLVRRVIRDGFVDLLEGTSLEDVVIAGTATAGIPHAAWLAEAVDRPMAYVRSASKSHGKQSRIEGVVEAGDEVLVVEDLISTGGSALSAVEALRDVGASVRSVLAIFSYELDAATDAFREAEVPQHVLTTFSTLLDVAQERGGLSAKDRAALDVWRDDPELWSDEHGGSRHG